MVVRTFNLDASVAIFGTAKTPQRGLFPFPY